VSKDTKTKRTSASARLLGIRDFYAGNISELPEKRNEILYARVTEANKAFVTEESKKKGVAESVLVNHILTLVRTKNAGKH